MCAAKHTAHQFQTGVAAACPRRRPHLGKQALGEAKFCYVTALTDPQIRALLAKKRLQLELFEDKPAEVEWGGKRYVLRCNPQTRTRERARRADQWARVQAKITARNL